MLDRAVRDRRKSGMRYGHGTCARRTGHLQISMAVFPSFNT
jgi:hypothetical protein